MTRGGLALIPLLLLALSCQPRGGPKNAVARVDDRTLTLEDIQSHFDTSRGISESQMQQFIQRWLSDELLYREAIRRGMDRGEDVTAKLDDIRRQLAINALLDREVYSTQAVHVTDQDLSDYYEAHKKEFVLSQETALVSYALFQNRDAATATRNTVLRGTPWSQALAQPVPPDHPSRRFIARVDSVYATQASLFPAELWRVAANAADRDPSYPISTSDGYYLLTVWKHGRQGQTADLKYVEDDIRGRMTIERRRQAFAAYVENLRAQHAVEIIMTPSSLDTTTIRVGE